MLVLRTPRQVSPQTSGCGGGGINRTRATKVICLIGMRSLRASTTGSQHTLDVDRYNRPRIFSALLHPNSSDKTHARMSVTRARMGEERREVPAMSCSCLLSLKYRRMVWFLADARLAVTNSWASCAQGEATHGKFPLLQDKHERLHWAHLIVRPRLEDAENVPLLQGIPFLSLCGRLS